MVAPVNYVPPKLQSARTGIAKPIARGQMDEGPVPIRIPSPAELGLESKKIVSSDSPIDWAMVERRLDQVGATGYRIQKSETGFRFSIEMRGNTIVGQGASKPEAVRSAFAQVKQ